MSTTRQEVYAAIDGERAYQNTIGATGPIKYKLDESRSIADYLVVLDTYIRKAKDKYTFDGSEAAMHQIRKLAAIAVSCMEDNGAPLRAVPEETPNPIPW